MTRIAAEGTGGFKGLKARLSTVHEESSVHGLHASFSLGRPQQHVRPKRRANTDEVKLLMLGYRQELAREFTLFNCFGSSFTALSTLTALAGTYGSIGMTYGGPVVMMCGWPVVMLFTMSVALSMAELASAYPTSGALYYWSYKLAPPRARNLLCWLTSWVLVAGQAAFTASNFYTLVSLINSLVVVETGSALTSEQQFGVLLGLQLVVGLLNCGSARVTAFMTTMGTMWHIVALAAFCVALPLIAPERNTVKYVFTSWQPNTEVTGISSPVYTVLVGLLMSQWTLTGYDGAAHVAEETFAAEFNVPRAILLCILGVGTTGYAFVLSLTFVKVDVAALFDPANETGGKNVVLQILIEVCKSAFNNRQAAVALFTIPLVGNFFCAYQSVANNSRMLYAFARDNGVPLSKFTKMVHPGTKAPIAAVLYMLVLAAVLSMPMCFNVYVFPAVTSFAVVGCYIAYSLPVATKLLTRRRYWLAGPFSLGRYSYANNVISLAWVATVTVLFTLPQFYPITLTNFNWSSPILGVVLLFAFGWYYLPVYGAKTWFIGPRANLGQFNDRSAPRRALDEDRSMPGVDINGGPEGYIKRSDPWVIPVEHHGTEDSSAHDADRLLRQVNLLTTMARDSVSRAECSATALITHQPLGAATQRSFTGGVGGMCEQHPPSESPHSGQQLAATASGSNAVASGLLVTSGSVVLDAAESALGAIGGGGGGSGSAFRRTENQRTKRPGLKSRQQSLLLDEGHTSGSILDLLVCTDKDITVGGGGAGGMGSAGARDQAPHERSSRPSVELFPTLLQRIMAPFAATGGGAPQLASSAIRRQPPTDSLQVRGWEVGSSTERAPGSTPQETLHAMEPADVSALSKRPSARGLLTHANNRARTPSVVGFGVATSGEITPAPGSGAGTMLASIIAPQAAAGAGASSTDEEGQYVRREVAGMGAVYGQSSATRRGMRRTSVSVYLASQQGGISGMAATAAANLVDN